MSRSTEVSLAMMIAATGVAAMVFWPPDTGLGDIAVDTPELVELDPGEDDTPEPAEDGEPDTEPNADDDTGPVAEEPDDDVLPAAQYDEAGEAFTWLPAGDLIEGSGTGQPLQINYVPGMRFPLEAGRAFANSQVYNYGGYLGPAGGQCNAQNYAYSWRDNFCETRGYSTPMCPTGEGHQGQDIRPATCQDAVHWAVAADDGTITSIGSYSVRLMSDDGVRYTYLHLEKDTLQVEVGDRVSQGERLGFVSNEFGSTATTIHLHFEIQMAIDTGSGIQNTPVPPYLALVDSYERLIESPGS